MSVTLTGIELEVYSGMVQPNYWTGDLFGNQSMQYRGAIDGEVVNHPVVTPGLALNKADATDHSAVETSSMESSEIPLEIPYKAVNHIMYSTIENRPGLPTLSSLGAANGLSIGNGKTIRLINLLTLAAVAAGNIVDVDEDATDGTAPAKVKTGVKRIATEMATDSVTPQGLHGLLTPSAFFNLGDENSIISVDYGGQANRQSQNSQTMLNYLNWGIKMSPIGFGTDWTNTANAGLALPSTMEADTRRIIGVFWQKDAWMLREQTQPQNSIDAIPEYQQWQILTRHTIGAKVILPAGVWVMRQAA